MRDLHPKSDRDAGGKATSRAGPEGLGALIRGMVPERSNGAHWKCDGRATSAAPGFDSRPFRQAWDACSSGQRALPRNQMVGSPARRFESCRIRQIETLAPLAQLDSERQPTKLGVARSSRARGATLTGRLAERPNATDCKSVSLRGVPRSNRGASTSCIAGLAERLGSGLPSRRGRIVTGSPLHFTNTQRGGRVGRRRAMGCKPIEQCSARVRIPPAFPYVPR